MRETCEGLASAARGFKCKCCEGSHGERCVRGGSDGEGLCVSEKEPRQESVRCCERRKSHCVRDVAVCELMASGSLELEVLPLPSQLRLRLLLLFLKALLEIGAKSLVSNRERHA
jgi:hypothetical protein